MPENSSSSSNNQDQIATKVEGGMPMHKGVLSFVVIGLIALSTIMTVLWLHEKKEQRENVSESMVAQQQLKTESTTESKKTYAQPQAVSYSAPIALPKPVLKGKMSVEQAIQERRSQRVFTDEAITQAELSQILWSAQGVTDDKGHRAAPSARSLYPFRVFVVVRNVSGIQPGLYEYLPVEHALGDLKVSNAGDVLNQMDVQDHSKKAPVVLLLMASFAKAAEKFPDTAEQVVFLEGGHIGQNIYLQVQALELGTVVSEGINPEKLYQLTPIDKALEPIYIVPVGHPDMAPAAKAE